MLISEITKKIYRQNCFLEKRNFNFKNVMLWFISEGESIDTTKYKIGNTNRVCFIPCKDSKCSPTLKVAKISCDYIERGCKVP